MDSPIKVITITMDEKSGEGIGFNYDGITHYEAFGMLTGVLAYVEAVIKDIAVANLYIDEDGD